jgi:hypothetical protein
LRFSTSTKSQTTDLISDSSPFGTAQRVKRDSKPLTRQAGAARMTGLNQNLFSSTKVYNYKKPPYPSNSSLGGYKIAKAFMANARDRQYKQSASRDAGIGLIEASSA